jgi:hypothetical protein
MHEYKWEIIYLDRDPRECARQLCDEDLKNQVMDLPIMMSYCARCSGRNESQTYASYNVPINNRSSMLADWAVNREANWKYLWIHWTECLKEHKHRFGIDAKSIELVGILEAYPGRRRYRMLSGAPAADRLVAPPYLGPSEFTIDNNMTNERSTSTLNSYRNMYKKRAGMEFTKRTAPLWLTGQPAPPRIRTPRDEERVSSRPTRATAARHRNAARETLNDLLRSYEEREERSANAFNPR